MITGGDRAARVASLMTMLGRRGGGVRAIVVHQFGDPSVLKLEDVPDPSPGPKQVVVSIRAVGVNPVETYIRSGSYAMKPPLPYTPGADAAGVIESVGSEISQFKP